METQAPEKREPIPVDVVRFNPLIEGEPLPVTIEHFNPPFGDVFMFAVKLWIANAVLALVVFLIALLLYMCIAALALVQIRQILAR